MSFTVSLEVPPRTGPLPRTGASIDLLVAVAVVLLVVGALIVKAVR
jgi:LPXTG-motif cell wall-anchored protein